MPVSSPQQVLGVGRKRVRDGAENLRNRAAEGLDGGDQHDGDKREQDSVFRRRRAAIVSQKLNQVTHEKSLPEVEEPRVVAFDHPADSTKSLQTRVK